jgi:hypothetical protein
VPTPASTVVATFEPPPFCPPSFWDSAAGCLAELELDDVLLRDAVERGLPPLRELPERELPERELPDRELVDRELPEREPPDRELVDRVRDALDLVVERLFPLDDFEPLLELRDDPLDDDDFELPLELRDDPLDDDLRWVLGALPFDDERVLASAIRSPLLLDFPRAVRVVPGAASVKRGASTPRCG